MKKTSLIVVFLFLIFIVSGCVPKGEADKHFENAVEFMNLQMMPEAMIEMNNGLRIMDKDPAFVKTPERDLLKAISLYFNGNNKEAEKELEKSIRAHKNYWNSFLLLAFIYVGDRKYDSAVAVMEKVPSAVFDYGQAEFVKGLDHIDKRQYGKAIKELEFAKDKFNQKSLSFKEDAGALQFIKKGSNLMVSYLLGQAYLEEGDLSNAEKNFLEVAALNPVFPGIKGDLEITKNKRELKDNPRDYSALNNLGWAYYEKGKDKEAIAAFRSAIAINPSFGLAYNNLGRTYYDQKNYQDAAYCFNKAIELNNDQRAFVFASYNLGQLLRRRRDFKQSLAVLEKGLKRNPADEYLKREYKIAMLENLIRKESNPDFYRDLGKSYMENNEFVDSADAYRKYLKYKNKDPWAYYNLGLAYSKAGLAKEAMAQFKKATELTPKFGLAYFEWGKLLRQSGNFDEATRVLNKTDLPSARYELAYAYFQAGEKQMAVTAFKRALKEKSGDDYKSKIKKILAVIE